MGSINGYSVLVTGGGSGIGEAAAAKLAADGANVMICGRTEEKLIAATERIKAGAADSTTVAHMVAIAEKRKDPSTFLASVVKTAPQISGFIAPTAASSTLGNPASVRFLGAQFVVPRPPGCRPGRYIPGCPNPPNTTGTDEAAPTDPIGLVERYQVQTEGQW